MRSRNIICKQLQTESGMAVVWVAILIVVLLGAAAFAIDIGYQRVVRNQLQNAADAAALAACNQFYARTPVTFPPPPPDWAAASAEAADAITLNKADNKQLQVGVTVTGWWDITQAYPGSMWPNPAASPPPNVPPNQNYGPAVNVAITKAAGINDGPIRTFFGNIFGVASTNVGAAATAVAASPGSVRQGALVPVAISRRAADQSNLYNSPANLITIGSPYMYPDTLAGQWTSFLMDTNNVPDVQGLIDSGNPTAINLGEKIWIQPGVKDNLYDATGHPSIQRNYAGENVVFPIIDGPVLDKTHSEVPVVGFIGFHVVCAGKGCNGMTPSGKNNEKVIMGYFTTLPVYGGGPVGPYYGPLDRCRLCQ